MNTVSLDPSADFDFQFGDWIVHHRRLDRRLCGSDEWTQFGGSASVRPILGGLGNLEDNELVLPEGPYRAIALRSYDSVKRQWAIWWLDGRRPHALDVPVVGEFKGRIGFFLRTTCLIRVRSRCVSRGMRAFLRLPSGSRRSRRMPGRHGKRIGSCDSNAPRRLSDLALERSSHRPEEAFRSGAMADVSNRRHCSFYLTQGAS